jgi:hypothetical protein
MRDIEQGFPTCLDSRNNVLQIYMSPKFFRVFDHCFILRIAVITNYESRNKNSFYE